MYITQRLTPDQKSISKFRPVDRDLPVNACRQKFRLYR